MKKALLTLLSLTFLAILCGCTSRTAQDGSIPWGRPANWEGTIPGMGSMGEGSPGAPR